MISLFKKYFGPGNRRLVEKLQPIVAEINGFESLVSVLSDEQLKAKTPEFKERLTKGETLEAILPEAFAVVREASKRATGMRHYDVQMIGGIVLHRGMIAEMRTGEGKTLVATLPVYLNALAGKGVHLVTVNDYLAKRDAVWMGKIYDWLGMTVGIIQNQRVSFIYDVTVEDDSILIDEARTPLIISAPAEEATEEYNRFADLVRQLKENKSATPQEGFLGSTRNKPEQASLDQGDYNLDEKMHSSTLTENGITKFEQWLGIANIYEEGGIRTIHHIEQALKAQVLFKRDRDYIVEGNEIIIIDEFTGRKMPGRRYSEGLHQALEAKEKLAIQKESQTLATITFQNLFRMYGKLSGMTGTAATEAEELFKIYHLEVVTIPTNKIDQRTDRPDRIYKTEAGKFQAVAEIIKECRTKNQPVLIGTISVEKNERLSEYLHALEIPHEILNAKNHEREGEIIAQAGRPDAVTLATNMAGRGVDIKLGGVPAIPADIELVNKAGGLFVLGTERHESRRIDNQLRGRAARQGDPGMTQFFVSTEDDLMRIFGGDRLKSVMTRLNVPDDMPIEQKMLTSLLENAQKKVEAHNFDIRKHLLEYDDVLNKQRTVIYEKRRKILDVARRENAIAELGAMINEDIEHEIESVVSFHTNAVEAGDWNVVEIYETVRTIFPLEESDKEKLLSFSAARGTSNFDDVTTRDSIVKHLLEKAKLAFDALQTEVNDKFPVPEHAKQMFLELQKGILLRAIDTFWVDHLVAIDYLRAGIGLQGYGQRDPLIEYKKQSFTMFHQLLSDIQKEVVYSFFKIGIGVHIAPSIMENANLQMSGAEKTAGEVAELAHKQSSDPEQKIGRNEPCYCGSGKKFKKCHGA